MKTVTFGEIMLRLSTPGFQRFVQAASFDVNYGGGEANVAVSLANYGYESAFVTKVPDHELGQAAVDSLRRFGVDTGSIIRGGDRLGIYYLETGDSMRPSKVIYDRARSAIAEADESEFDFEGILRGADWFHFTGITPALGAKAQRIVLKALQACRKLGVRVSCDLNYRKKLWTKAEAQRCMNSLMPYVDYVIGNEEDAEACLGFIPEGTDVTKGRLELEGYERMFAAMVEKYGFKGVCSSLRVSHSASDNGWSGLLYLNGRFYQSRAYEIRLVDRVGGGDAFAAGLIYGLTAYDDPQKAIDFAAGASALKQTLPGDYNHVSVAEVEALIGGDASGRVQR